MPKIEILPDVLASQVAAGEVVERPASVVKEMVENSIDAGAKHIQVEIHKGGATLIKITDDGSGMNKADALMCLERHATSKLKTSQQLASIATMGFRGEAVPSIASVSKLRIATQEQGAVEGTEIMIDGGVVKEVRVTGMQSGTVFEIKNLFFNVPARRKFMRTENTESAHVEHQVKLHALAYPEIRFTFKKEGRVIFDVPGASDHRTRIAGLFGAQVGKDLVEVPATEQGGMEIHGYVLPAEYARKGRRQQYVFLNGRPVEDAAISRAIKDGYKGGIIDGLNPTAWLWLAMNPALVDVNVHPAKKEVRFHKPYDVRNLVFTAVENRRLPQPSNQELRGEAKIISRKSGVVAPVRPVPATEQDHTHQGIHQDTQSGGERAKEAEPIESGPQPSSDRPAPTSEGAPSFSSSLATDREAQAQPNKIRFPQPAPVQEVLEIEQEPRPVFKTLCVLHDKYILLEGDEGLVVLEPKAARARIVYEQILTAASGGKVESQGLLVPEVIDLDSRDLDVVMSNLENFAEAGISIEPFGGGSIQVRSLPAMLEVKKPREFIAKMIDELIDTQGAKRGRKMAFETFAETISQRASRDEQGDLALVDQLLDSLFTCDLPYCDPQGRPTLIQISLQELEKKFR